MQIGVGEGQSTTIQTSKTSDKIAILPGKLEAPQPSDNNFHRVFTREFVINGQRRRVELLHQLRAGDCGLANFLNTYSIEEAYNHGVDGKLPMTIQEARQAVIRVRQRTGEDFSDITSPDSAISYKDIVRLFSSIHSIPPKQEDILTVDGRDKTTTQLRLDSLTILDYLATYPSGLCTTGLGIHSRTIKKIQGDNYLLIDPMDSSGMETMNTAQLMDFLANHMNGRQANDNFFFFIRKI